MAKELFKIQWPLAGHMVLSDLVLVHNEERSIQHHLPATWFAPIKDIIGDQMKTYAWGEIIKARIHINADDILTDEAEWPEW